MSGPVGDPRELLLAHLGKVREIVAFIAQRYRLSADQQADLEAHVRLRLIENDYAILRSFHGRSALGTYLTVVVGHLAQDFSRRDRNRRKAAQAGGVEETAVDPLLLHERRRDPLPSPETSLLLRHAHASIARAVAGAFRRLQPRDRLLLRLRYVESATVPALARLLELAPRTVERRLHALLAVLRRDLQKAGVDPGDVRSVLAEIPDHELGFSDTLEAAPSASPLDEVQDEDRDRV